MLSSCKSNKSKANIPSHTAPNRPRAALEALLTGCAADPIRRALWLDALDQRLRPHLSPTLAPHTRLANVNGLQLIFLVDAPVWRARLRLAATELLAAARAAGLDAEEIVIRTALRTSDPAPPPQAARPMSAAASHALRSALASLSPPDLRSPDGGGRSPRSIRPDGDGHPSRERRRKG